MAAGLRNMALTTTNIEHLSAEKKKRKDEIPRLVHIRKHLEVDALFGLSFYQPCLF
jgi:hypothetical protein